MIEQIREKARELLISGRVSCVIGYERASDGLTARPAFVYEPEEVERLIFDQTCTHNLAKYLLDKKGKPTAIVAKGCDARAINVLLGEKQLDREKVFVIGAVCPGIRETRFGQVEEGLELRCQECTMHTPPVYDFLVGEPAAERAIEPYADVAEFEKRPPAEREAFWKEQMERCIRCYACRQVCFGCYCSECFVERLDPEWVGIRIDQPQNWMWAVIRAFHLAGRCVGCDQCQRVCPVKIPLRLLNARLDREVSELFRFRPGADAEEKPPLAAFLKEENLGYG